MSNKVGFYHGALSDTYEKQANAQGFTFGRLAKWIEKVGFGIVAAHINGCITDAEYDRILRRFQNKILVANLKPIKAGKKGADKDVLA